MSYFSPKAQGLIAINLAALLFGTTALFGKLAVSPFWIVALRALCAAGTLALFARPKKDVGLFLTRTFPILVGTGCLLALHWVTFFLSVQTAGVAIATLTFSTFPLFTIVLTALHRQRMPHLLEIGAGLAIILAIDLLLLPQDQTPPLWGTGMGLLSAFAFATFGYASQYLPQNFSRLRLSLFQNLLVFLLLLPTLPFWGPPPQNMTEWFFILVLAVLGTACMHQLYFYALQRLSANTCSAFVALEPLYAIIFAALLFHDPISWRIMISFGLILGASYALHLVE